MDVYQSDVSALEAGKSAFRRRGAAATAPFGSRI